MIKSVSSQRKIAAKGVASPRSPRVIGGNSGVVKNSPVTTPRTPRKVDVNIKPAAPRELVKEAADKVEVMELPARLAAGCNSLNLKGTSSGDRIRNGGAGDSCMRLPLECMSKGEIKDEMKDGTLSYHHFGFHDDDENSPNEEEEQEEFDDEKMTTVLGPDRARFNIWKGTNYDLHVLGNFKSDFERRVKSFQRPETISISMNPFCRSESGLTDEPCKGDAFLIWKNNKSDQWQEHNGSDHDITTLISSEEDDHVDHFDDDSDADSLPDPEILEYIRGQREKVKEGLSLTGETLYYDEEFGVVRNLHRESHSLTNYGVMPDDNWIGKAHVFYPEMTLAEKNMLKAVVSRDEITAKN